MSKLDDLLNGTLVFAFDARDSRRDDLRKLILDASDELAALRRRAEDAEMMLRWAIRGTGRATEIVKMPPGSRREGQFVAVEWENGFNRQRFELDSDTTGLPVLNDEARKALGGADG